MMSCLDLAVTILVDPICTKYKEIHMIHSTHGWFDCGLVTSMDPPCSSTIVLAMNRPYPLPPPAWEKCVRMHYIKRI